MWEFIFWTAGIYLVIGVVTTMILSQTPYSGNSWIVTTLLWPVFFLAMIGV